MGRTLRASARVAPKNVRSLLIEAEVEMDEAFHSRMGVSEAMAHMQGRLKELYIKIVLKLEGADG